VDERLHTLAVELVEGVATSGIVAVGDNVGATTEADEPTAQSLCPINSTTVGTTV